MQIAEILVLGVVGLVPFNCVSDVRVCRGEVLCYVFQLRGQLTRVMHKWEMGDQPPGLPYLSWMALAVQSSAEMQSVTRLRIVLNISSET